MGDNLFVKSAVKELLGNQICPTAKGSKCSWDKNSNAALNTAITKTVKSAVARANGNKRSRISPQDF